VKVQTAVTVMSIHAVSAREVALHEVEDHIRVVCVAESETRGYAFLKLEPIELLLARVDGKDPVRVGQTLRITIDDGED
jgi:hypothetical protein